MTKFRQNRSTLKGRSAGQRHTHRQTSRLVFTARLRLQFRMPPIRNARRASIAARWCFSSTAAARCCMLVLHSASSEHTIRSAGRCRNGKFQNLSPPSVLFESSRIFFYNTQEAQTQKMMDQKLFSKRRRAVPLRPMWTIMFAAKLDQSRVLSLIHI